MGGFDILNLLAVTIAPLVSMAATVTPTVLPVDTNYSQLALAEIAGAQFSTDPTKSAMGGSTDTNTPIEIFILTKGIKEDGSISFIVNIHNTGNKVAKEVALGVTHPDSMVFTKSEPSLNNLIKKDAKTELMWFLPDIAPKEQINVSLGFSGEGDPKLGAQISYSYDDVDKVADTVYSPNPRVLQAVAQPLPAKVGPTPSAQPAIICDPNIDNGCKQILPNLGVNFQNALQLDSHPVICSVTDPEPCEDKRPTLGERFTEAVAVTEPGECRVNEDARIVEPAFQDSFLRKEAPAAYYMVPLFDSGQDFKALVLKGIIEGIKYNINARKKLIPIWQDAYNKHNDIINSVLRGDITGEQAIAQLDNLIVQLSARLQTAQGNPAGAYQIVIDTVRKGYDKEAGKAVENAAKSILRACHELNGEPEALAERLQFIKETYLVPLLSQLPLFYPDQIVPQISTLTALRAYWSEALYPALRAFDQGDSGPLKAYNRGNTMALFDDAFRATYISQADFAEQALEGFRLDHWEVELDTPKSTATECEFKEKVEKVIDPVETTRCEAGTVVESEIPLNKDASDTVKGTAQPPTVVGSDNENGLPGIACAGGPGDPYWATHCECKCGDVVTTNSDGSPVFCEQVYKITRHDIFITDTQECKQEPQPEGHFNPF